LRRFISDQCRFGKKDDMPTEKPHYFEQLSAKDLSTEFIDKTLHILKDQGMQINPIPKDLIKKNEFGEKITEYLTRLPLSIVEGNSSWEGLLVGFPGNRKDLATQSVGSPYLRMILYPILDLHHRLQNRTGKRLPCLYFVGERFSGVFLRKFELLQQVVPHIIVLTNDIYQCSTNKALPKNTEKTVNESWTQMKLSHLMASPEGLLIPSSGRDIRIKFLSYEVPCFEGTENPERLDLLGYDMNDHALVAFELKGQSASRVELENLFLQGIEHRNWLEKNRMAIKLLFDGGPGGRRINTKKRARLFLGFYGDAVPHLFLELREQAELRDPYLEIRFIQLKNELGEVSLLEFEPESPK
jgi:hypothetical protein